MNNNVSMQPISEKRISELQALGFKRWTKGNFDRLYINAKSLGLVCWYYNTGNISSATFQDEKISNAQARRFQGAKTFIDIKTGRVHSQYSELEDAARELAKIPLASD